MSNNVVGQTIKEIRKRKGITQKELSKLTGFSQNTISNHENGNRGLNVNDIEKYCMALQVPVDQLFEALDITESLNKSIMIVDQNAEFKVKVAEIMESLPIDLNEEIYLFAKEKIDEFESEGKNKHYLKLIENKDKKFKRIIKIQSKLSAGTGILDLDPEETSEEVEFTGIVPRHDLAFRVVGNSMTPMFENGEIVFVKNELNPINGAIMAVAIDDEAYVKKIYVEGNQLRLVSLNKAYDDIIADETNDIRIIGKVVFG